MNISRRNFSKKLSAGALASAVGPWGWNLAAMGDAAAQTAVAGNDDYKALVCVFLWGGNDYANTLVPADTKEYEAYRVLRGGDWTQSGGLAVPFKDLLPLNAQTTNNKTYGLAPSMPGLAGLFNAGKMAALLNVGPLIKPLNRDTFKTGRLGIDYPESLFSHNSQQRLWQSTSAGKVRTGWGGKVGGTQSVNNAIKALTCINMTEHAEQLLRDPSVSPYKFSPIRILGFSSGAAYYLNAINTLFQPGNFSDNLFTNGYSSIYNNSVFLLDTVKTKLAPETEITNINDYGTDALAAQLKMVARIIASHRSFGIKRQIFTLTLMTFDHHDALTTAHPVMLQKVSQALSTFYATTKNLGMADKVTSFTASDFGRTLVPNNDGSDHGWGSHHFIMGDAVKGKNFYGMAPGLDVVNGAEYVENSAGRLIPTTSVDQYGATLARWFGVTDEAVLQGIFPNLKNFATSDLKFMNV